MIWLERMKAFWKSLDESEQAMLGISFMVFFSGLYALYYNELKMGLLYTVGGALLLGYAIGYIAARRY